MVILNLILKLVKNLLFGSVWVNLITGGLTAQEINFQRVELPGSTSFGLVNEISQDPQGYMWMATYNKGLHRYDGYHLHTYLNNPKDLRSLASNNLEALHADRNGIIWIGTQEHGLDRFDPVTGMFSHFRHTRRDSTSISDDRITRIIEDRNGGIWVGTMHGLNRFDKTSEKFTRYFNNETDPHSLSGNRIQSLYESRDGIIWVGCSDRGPWRKAEVTPVSGGLNRLDNATGKFQRYMHNPNDANSLADNRIGAIYEDSKGTFWVMTANDCLHIMNRELGTFQRYFYNPQKLNQPSSPPRKKDIHIDLNLFFICEDATGALWIGASGGWITRYDHKTNRAKHYSSFNDGTSAMDKLSGAYTSRDGMLWLRSWIGNFYRVNSLQGLIRHTFTGAITHGIYEDQKSSIWLSQFPSATVKVNRDSGNVNILTKGLGAPFDQKDFILQHTLEDSEGNIWIGRDGLDKLNTVNNKLIKFKHDPTNKKSIAKGPIGPIIEDETGGLWLGTSSGLDLFHMQNGEFIHFNFMDNKEGNRVITAIRKDHTGKIWIGTHDGMVYHLDPATTEVNQFLFAKSIGSIAEDCKNIIWIGTDNGLYTSNTTVDSFRRFSDPRIRLEKTTTITAMLEDDEQFLWIGSSAGIIRINPNGDDISVYDKTQGVDGSTMSYPYMGACKGRWGEFHFGNSNGFYSFFPGNFKSNIKPPQIIVSDFWLADKRVTAGKDSPLKVPLSKVRQIKLPHTQRDFSFDFAAIHYSSPKENQLFFMLENLEKNWRKGGPEKKASYYNVPPGHYIFRIRAANPDGIWAERAINLMIAAPWWRQLWVKIILSLLVGSILYRATRWRLHHVFRQKLERSERETQLAEMRRKTAELHQMTITLEMQALRAQMNPHFIFNSLNSINRFILQNNKLRASEYLTKFSRLMRLILQNSQAVLIPLESELECLALYLELEAVRFEQHFDYKIMIDSELDVSIIKVPPLIIQPFAENAIWHGLMQKEEKGTLEINLSQQGDQLFIQIQDNGIGRKKASELKNRSSATHKPVGMQISADRIAILHKKLQTESVIEVLDRVLPDGSPGGTEVLIKIPMLYD